MRYSFIAATLALATFVSAAPSSHKVRQSQDACENTYNACLASGRAMVACQCDLAACVGEDDERERDFCATATAASALAAMTSTTAAAASYTAANTYTSTYTFYSNSAVPGGLGCNPAHPGSCPTPTAGVTIVTVPYNGVATAPSNTYTSTSTFTSINGIPGGCNPAHPGSCPTPSAGVTVVTVASSSVAATATMASASTSVKASGTAVVPPVYTGAADRVKPAMAIIALGALALL